MKINEIINILAPKSEIKANIFTPSMKLMTTREMGRFCPAHLGNPIVWAVRDSSPEASGPWGEPSLQLATGSRGLRGCRACWLGSSRNPWVAHGCEGRGITPWRAGSSAFHENKSALRLGAETQNRWLGLAIRVVSNSIRAESPLTRLATIATLSGKGRGLLPYARQPSPLAGGGCPTKEGR